MADKAEKGSTWAALRPVHPQGPRVTSLVSVLPEASPAPAAALLGPPLFFTGLSWASDRLLCIEDCLSQHRCPGTACSQVTACRCGPVG